MKTETQKPDRLHVKLDDPAVARHWAKHFGKTKEEIAAAIEKVGSNADTLKREFDRSE